MSSAQPSSAGRETRLLLVTIAVSVAALLLLARFRFPQQAVQPAEPAPAPLERLAARAAYDELASTMADLERTIYPRVLVYRVTPDRPSGSYVIAPRLTGSRAAVVLDQNESLDAVSADVDLVTHDPVAGVAVLNLPDVEEFVVSPRTSAVRTGPRYVAVVEGTAQGPTLRPLYVGRTALSESGGGPLALLTVHGLQANVPHGAAIFSLDGSFLGLVNAPGTVTSVISAESLRTLAETAQPQTSRVDSELGVEVQNADQGILRAAASDRGVVVTYVRRGGPTESELRPGDVIHSVDELETNDIDAYKRAARTRVPGKPTTIKFSRRGTERQVTVRARAAAEPAAVAGIGIEGRSVRGVGIEVIAVEPEGSAAQAGLRRGDLILTVDGEPLTDVGRLLRAYRAVRVGTALVLSIERDARHLIVAVEKR